MRIGEIISENDFEGSSDLNENTFIDSLSQLYPKIDGGSGMVFYIDGYRVSFLKFGDNSYTLNRIDGSGGKADAVMKEVTRIAKETKTTLDLFVRPQSPLRNDMETRQRLVGWYERNGFVPVRGENRKSIFIRKGDETLHMQLV